MDKIFRMLPPFKGKFRLARLLLGDIIKVKKDIEIIGKYGCKYLLPNLTESVGFDIFINGEYEPEIQKLLINLMPVGGSFLDLGANIGSTIIPLCARRRDVNAIGVEAAPWVFTYLERNIEKNRLSNVKLISKALFNEDNKRLNFFSPQDNFGKGSLAPVFTQQGMEVTTIKVDTLLRDLDVKKVDVVKIDVEGFEYFVFQGAEELLRGENAPTIIFEFVDWAEQQAMGLKPGTAQQFLIDLGYNLYRVESNKFVKQTKCQTSGSCNIIASKVVIPSHC